MLETTGNPELGALWQQVTDRWAAPLPDSGDDEAVMRFIARLAADGLWGFEALAAQPLPDELRARIINRLVGLSSRKGGWER